MNIKCTGCGATIQTDDVDKKGYIDPNVLKKHKKSFYCKRCFDLKHYNKDTKINVSLSDYIANLEKIKKDNGLIVYIVDAFDLEGTLSNNINKIFQSENILLVLNKVDLYINSINSNKIITYVRKHIKEKNIKVKDMLIMSAFNNQDIEKLYDKIIELHGNRNIYFVGMTNVGKSTIINKIIEKYTGEEDIITVSNTLNTTLDNIYIPLNNKNYIIDTPGLIDRNNLIYFVDKKTLEFITPKKYVKPKTFQLNPGQSLFIQGFVRINFIEGERSSFIGHFANNVLIHRTKLENANKFYDEHKFDVLIYPTADEISKLGKIVTKKVKINKDAKIDIAISGLGFLTVSGNCYLEVEYFNNVRVITRKAMI